MAGINFKCESLGSVLGVGIVLNSRSNGRGRRAEKFLEQQHNNENNDNAAQIKAERASFEMDEESHGTRGSRGSRRRRIDLASIDKRYWYALALPALFLTMYFSTNLNTWFGSTSDLKVQFALTNLKKQI